MKINIDILMSDFHSCQLESTRETREIHNQLEKLVEQKSPDFRLIFMFSLSVLVRAIGDSTELTQNSTDKKLRMVEKETDCRLKHLQVNVERLKSILLTSDLGK